MTKQSVFVVFTYQYSRFGGLSDSKRGSKHPVNGNLEPLK